MYNEQKEEAIANVVITEESSPKINEATNGKQSKNYNLNVLAFLIPLLGFSLILEVAMALSDGVGDLMLFFLGIPAIVFMTIFVAVPFLEQSRKKQFDRDYYRKGYIIAAALACLDIFLFYAFFIQQNYPY